jgi:hypothetical protein
MLRRPAAATLFLLMLNVMALGDGMLSLGGRSDCDLMSAANAASMSDMAGMDMGSTPAPDNKSAPAPGKSGCNLPWAPGCTSVVPCGPTAAVVTPAHHVAFRVSVPLIRGIHAVAPEFLALAPELPPPRA